MSTITQHDAPKSKEKEKQVSSILITKREAASRYGISLRTISTLIGDGVIPVIRLSKRMIRINPTAADQALQQLQTGGTQLRKGGTFG